MTARDMTRTAFFVLTALAEQPLHGYGIVQEVDAVSEGRVQLRIGTLYGVLDRLAADGLIELDREEAHGGRLRRYYRITDSGEAELSAEAERMALGARTAADRIASRRPSHPDGTDTETGEAGSHTPAPKKTRGARRPGLAGGGA